MKLVENGIQGVVELKQLYKEKVFSSCGCFVPRAVLMDLEPGTMDSVQTGPYGQITLFLDNLRLRIVTVCKLLTMKKDVDEVGKISRFIKGKFEELDREILVVFFPSDQGICYHWDIYSSRSCSTVVGFSLANKIGEGGFVDVCYVNLRGEDYNNKLAQLGARKSNKSKLLIAKFKYEDSLNWPP
ncbi:hypothetical protein V6N13_044763 [Hibiscus sabdariffa]